MTKKTILFGICTFFSLTTSLLSAQVQSGCEPSSCGPDDTKTGEARAITELRNELQVVLKAMSNSPLDFNPELMDYKIKKGKSDDESVLYIDQATDFVRSELLRAVPQDRLRDELTQYTTTPPQNKQDLVAALKKEIKIFSAQIKALK